MSRVARLRKQEFRRIRSEAPEFYFHGWRDDHQNYLHEESNRLARDVKIPDGWEPISHKRRVAFRLPKAGERFINSDGYLDRAAYPWEAWAFGHGPRWIVRRKRHA
jgi:hypothetical protein